MYERDTAATTKFDIAIKMILEHFIFTGWKKVLDRYHKFLISTNTHV